jgi:hypothetical protein
MFVARKLLPMRLKNLLRAAVSARQRMRAERQEVEEWEHLGRPVPPPHLVKQRTVIEFAQNYRLDTLVETGTFLGDMVHGCRKRFERIISIELDHQLYENACRRFASDRHIEILRGDSGDLLPKVLEGLSVPCLFWLDGHYSAGFTAKGDLNTPVMDELEAICEHPVDGHVILIDDARCFTGEEDYPTIAEVEAFISRKKPDYEFELDLDIMRITPPRTNENELSG